MMGCDMTPPIHDARNDSSPITSSCYCMRPFHYIHTRRIIHLRTPIEDADGGVKCCDIFVPTQVFIDYTANCERQPFRDIHLDATASRSPFIAFEEWGAETSLVCAKTHFNATGVCGRNFSLGRLGDYILHHFNAPPKPHAPSLVTPEISPTSSEGNSEDAARQGGIVVSTYPIDMTIIQNGLVHRTCSPNAPEGIRGTDKVLMDDEHILIFRYQVCLYGNYSRFHQRDRLWYWIVLQEFSNISRSQSLTILTF